MGDEEERTTWKSLGGVYLRQWVKMVKFLSNMYKDTTQQQSLPSSNNPAGSL